MPISSVPRVPISGSRPEYGVKVNKLFALAYTRNLEMPKRSKVFDGRVYPTINDLMRKYDPSSMKRSDTRLFWFKSECVTRGVSYDVPSPVQRSNAEMGRLVVLRS